MNSKAFKLYIILTGIFVASLVSCNLIFQTRIQACPSQHPLRFWQRQCSEPQYAFDLHPVREE